MRDDLVGPQALIEPQPIKILMTADSVGGVWQYSLDLARELSAQGAKILLATMGPPTSLSNREAAGNIRDLKLVESDYALEWMANPWNDVDEAGRWLLSLEAGFGPDLVHLNGYSHAALPWRKPVVVTAHSCVFSWWKAVYGGVPGDEWTEYRNRVNAGLQACFAVVSPSRYMWGEIEQIYGLQDKRHEIIHNFSAAARHGEQEKQPLIFAAGRVWDPAKNIDLLNQIADRVEWEIRVAGNSDGTTEDTTVEQLGELPHAELIGQLQSSAIFAHPSLYEPFGLVVLEAAQSGCALVLSDIPSLRELWEGAAIFVNPRDEEQWIAALNGLARDPAARRMLASHAQTRAAEFSADAALRKYRMLYDSLLKAQVQAA